MSDSAFHEDTEQYIAVIGMSGAFPGSPDIYTYWENLLGGKCTISDISDEELLATGLPGQVLDLPNYVKRAGILEDALCFDARFFGYGNFEAEIMDPQHRVFLEHCWHALESAGYIPDEIQQSVGVYAGCSMNRYVLSNLNIDIDAFGSADFQKMIGNDKDFLATRVAYKLNLKGPALDIQTACSTSLVTVQMGVLSLLTYQSDIALCGGVSINSPHGGGYLYSDGLILSPDGNCRTFSENANGTVFGEGVGVVVLKRYDEALEDQDNILAIIKSAAVNNDGSDKVGYTAPSLNGQVDVIRLAQDIAQLKPTDIHYLETHGTGTKLGDSIEISALEKAFIGSDSPCALGTLKANIGHLDAAAGIASFIKAVFIAHSRKLPPNYSNSEYSPDYKGDGPFYFLGNVKELEDHLHLNVAVSSFGVGGTNAHVIVSSPLELEVPKDNCQEVVPLLYSGKNESSLAKNQTRVDRFALEHREKLPKIASTLVYRRKMLPYRTYSIVETPVNEIVNCKVTASSKRMKASENHKISFMFSGQGSQYRQMGKELYDQDRGYRYYLDQCFSITDKLTDTDIRGILLEESSNDDRITCTRLTQLSLFCVEYSLAKSLVDYGIRPDILIGHSLGEYTAACIAGVFSLKDAIMILHVRGGLMSKTQQGGMLAVLEPRENIEPKLFGSLAVSVENSPQNTVISGSNEEIEKLSKQLKDESVHFVPVATKFCFHSQYMDIVLDEFLQVFKGVQLSSPSIEIACCTPAVTSQPFVTAEYWVEHLRKEVNFREALENKIVGQRVDIAIEIGPGDTLLGFLQRSSGDQITRIACLPNFRQKEATKAYFTKALAELWCAGVDVDLGVNGIIQRERAIDMPGYQFDREVHLRNEIQRNEALPVDVTQLNKPVQMTEENNHVGKGELVEFDKLRTVWESYIYEENYNDTDNFFDLGGHSLNAIQLIAECNGIYSKKVEVAEFFENPTFHGLKDLMCSDVNGTNLSENLSKRIEENFSESQANLAKLAGVMGNQKRNTRMREHVFCKYVLAYVYGKSRKTVKDIIEKIILKLEGGELYSKTLRKLYKKHFNISIGDYTAGCFSWGRIKRGTSVGRYSSITPTARFETADHPSSTISSSGIFYQASLGFSDGAEIPRNTISIGNDVFIGHNATLVYPCSSIGDGAIIGTGTIVNFDVPPYAVVGGFPAKIIRYRFTKDKVEKLIQSKWWLSDLEDLYEVRAEFTKPVSGRIVR